MSVSFNAGNFGNLTAGSSNNPAIGQVKQEVQELLNTLSDASKNAQSMATQYSEQSGSLSDKARTYQSMADASDDPALKAKFQKQADEFKAQAEEAKAKFTELNDFLKEVTSKQNDASVQMQALNNYGNPSSGGVQFKSAEMLEAEGKTFHSFAKDGNHWYADEPKENSSLDLSGILKNIKDFIGSPSFSAYDSMRKDNPNGIL